MPTVLSEHDGKDATVYAQLGGRLPYLSVYDYAQGDEPCEGFEDSLLAYLQSFVLHGWTGRKETERGSENMAVQRHPTYLCLSHPPVREGEDRRIRSLAYATNIYHRSRLRRGTVYRKVWEVTHGADAARRGQLGRRSIYLLNRIKDPLLRIYFMMRS